MTPWIPSIPIAFLAGTIPFGLLIGRAKGVDIRSVGSGNIGATNLGRVLGKRFFLLCFFLDFLKGFAPVLIAGWIAGVLGAAEVDAGGAWLWVSTMVAPVLGNVFNPWLGFKGGKGVATSLGALVAVYPYLTVPAAGVFAVFLAVLFAGRIMSVASMAAAVSLPVLVLALWQFPPGWLGTTKHHPSLAQMAPFLVVSILLATLVLWAHRANIQRVLAGTEPRLGQRPASPGPKKL